MFVCVCVCVCVCIIFYALNRIIEDYAVVYFGSALYKILRLLLVALFSVHIFACAFFRVKVGPYHV